MSILQTISPATGARGTQMTVTITGDAYTEDMNVSFGPGIVVMAVRVGPGDGVAEVDIIILEQAPVGSHNVSVTTATHSGFQPGGFTVT
ncbi:hypothetical protein [Cucumibacter marinus]|uniref:hypothetical protein n=1 Tax=Cucumibacter marinus TaxID=1121252 RepID=UPI0003F82EA9|nr:hypothetical protein [Cucumibacter marinus]